MPEEEAGCGAAGASPSRSRWRRSRRHGVMRRMAGWRWRLGRLGRGQQAGVRAGAGKEVADRAGSGAATAGGSGMGAALGGECKKKESEKSGAHS